MSPLEVATAIGAASYAGGVFSGLATSVTLLRRRVRRLGCPDPDAHVLSASDHDQLASEFAQHAQAVARQVSEFADALAGDDLVLRERLRRFESIGGRS